MHALLARCVNALVMTFILSDACDMHGWFIIPSEARLET